MKKLFLLISLLWFSIGMIADDTVSAKKQINSIKKDSRYLYADITATTAEDAENLAEEALYDYINEWVANQEKMGKHVDATTLHKDNWKIIAMPRGNMFRSFMYVMKSNEVSEGKSESEQVAKTSNFSNVNIPELVMEIASCTEYADLANKITTLKEIGEISNYGRYASLDRPQDYYLAIYNREGKIVAVLSSGSNRINIQTKQPDSEKNYKGCGAIGFKLKN